MTQAVLILRSEQPHAGPGAVSILAVGKGRILTGGEGGAAQVAVTYMWRGVPLTELASLLLEHLGPDARVWLDVVFHDQRQHEDVAQAVRPGQPSLSAPP